LNRPEVGVSYLRRNQSLKGLRSTEGWEVVLNGYYYVKSIIAPNQDLTETA
jgi:hypothetical protein